MQVLSGTDLAGLVERLTETVPAQARGIAEYFVSRLEDEELVVLASALDKVTLDCTFG